VNPGWIDTCECSAITRNSHGSEGCKNEPMFLVRIERRIVWRLIVVYDVRAVCGECYLSDMSILSRIYDP
jgi:hypothetical protein